ncbi:MAG: DUF1924 domain-containing protein [Nitrosomonadales bacterium]|nr:DUF1924 domain-containing protein [Nitrosomonadales bacterium]
MKKTCLSTIALAAALFTASTAWATPATDELLTRYTAEGASSFDAARGGKNWEKKVKGEDGETMSCQTCHGEDLGKSSKHHKTGKVIEPMAPSINKERLTEVKKIEKWFKRNCKDTWARECTPQEKGDFLKFLLAR